MAYQSSSTMKLGADEFGIAICNGLLGTHLGIAYVNEAGVGKILHLAFHRQLKLDNMAGPDLWAISIVPIDPDLAPTISSLISTLSTKFLGLGGGGVGYGINLYEAINGLKKPYKYVLGDKADGFTCASFVAAIFEGIGLPLVNVMTWDEDERNRAWGQAIVCMLKCAEAPQKHVETVEGNISGFRLLPEEVAAAAEMLAPPKVASHADTKARAPVIVVEMRVICGAPEAVNHPCYGPCVTAFDQGLAAIDAAVAAVEAKQAGLVASAKGG